MLRKVSLVILFCISISALFAQETQVSFDKEGKIMEIDANIEKDLQLFPEIQNFVNALLFKISEDRYVVEISYKSGDETLRTKQNLDKTGFEELQVKIELMVEKRKPKSVLDQAGKGLFLLNTTLIATAVYGPLFPLAFKIDDPATIAGSMLVTGGAGFFIPWLLSENREITRPEAILTSGFLYSGILHGISLSGIMLVDFLSIHSPDSLTQDDYINFLSSSAFTVIGTSIGEGFLGYYAAKALHLSEGEAAMYAYLNLIGYLDGILTTVIMESDKTEDIFPLSLAGSGVGLLSGALLNATGEYKTTGNTIVFSTVSLLGMTVALALEHFIYNPPSLVCAILLGGQISGSITGHFLVKGKEFTEVQGNLMALSAIGGSLVGAGLCLMINQPDYYILAGWAGACAGFLTTYLIASKDASLNSVRNGNDTKLNIAFHPESIALKTITPLYKNIDLPLLEVTYSY